MQPTIDNNGPYRVPCPAGAAHPTIERLRSGCTQTIVAYGCSLTAGGAWVGQVSTHLEKMFGDSVRMINSGESRMCSRWGIQNLASRVLLHKPDLVFIEFATNDAFEEYSVTFDEARGNLSSMIKQIREQNALCEIAIVIMNPVFGKSAGFRPNLHSYYDLYRQVAKAYDLQLIDIFADWQKVLTANPELQPQLIPDGLHPSPQGCERVITPAVLDALGIG